MIRRLLIVSNRKSAIESIQHIHSLTGGAPSLTTPSFFFTTIVFSAASSVLARVELRQLLVEPLRQIL